MTTFRQTMVTGTAVGAGGQNIPWASTFNSSGLDTYLGARGSALHNWINTIGHAMSLAQILGDREIIPTRIAGGAKAPLTYSAWSGFSALAQVPDQFRTKLIISLPVGAGINATLYADEVYGRRLALITNSFGSAFCAQSGTQQFRVEVMLDGLVITTASGPLRALVPGALSTQRERTFTWTIDHPYAAASGAYGDQTIAFDIELVTDAVFVLGLGETGAESVDRILSELGPERPNPLFEDENTYYSGINTFRTIRTRYHMATSFLAQRSRMEEINAALARSRSVVHHQIGFVYASSDPKGHEAESGPGHVVVELGDESLQVDVRAALSLEQLDGAAVDSRRIPAYRTAEAAAATLEGSLFHQILNAPDAASTAEKFYWANSRALRFYNFTGASQASVNALVTATAQPGETLPAGVNSTVYKNAIGAASLEGRTVVAPGEYFLGPGLPCGALSGRWGSPSCVMGHPRGGALVSTNAAFDQIGNDLAYQDAYTKGGGGTGFSATLPFLQVPTPTEIQNDKARISDRAQIDPRTGRLTYVTEDLFDTGAGPTRLSYRLTFTGSIDEPRTDNWTYEVQMSGSGQEAMGQTRPINAVPTIVALAVAQDIYSSTSLTGTDRVAQEVGGLLVAQWWSRYLQDNVATVQLGDERQAFVRRYDGAFNPPPMSVATLTQTGARVAQNASVVGVIPTFRRWNTSAVAYRHISEGQDETDFAYWQWIPAGLIDPAEAGWRGTQLRYKSGSQINFGYSAVPCNQTFPCTRTVQNSFGWTLTIAPNTVSDGHGRSISMTGGSVTDPEGYTTQFTLGCPIGRVGCSAQQITSVSTPVDTEQGAGPSLVIDFDVLARVSGVRVGVSRAGTTTTYAQTQHFFG
ncbi:MAG: hypothetical protein WDM79_14905 [Terricaulis sp.]